MELKSKQPGKPYSLHLLVDAILCKLDGGGLSLARVTSSNDRSNSDHFELAQLEM